MSTELATKEPRLSSTRETPARGFFTKLMLSPVYILQSLSRSFQITFSLYSMVFLVIFIATLTYMYVRYKYLTRYSRLPEDSERQEPVIDTFMIDSRTKDNSDQTRSYLDEFLSAIKIFGYLDSEVFHELTKSLQTQKLDSGEIIFLGELKGFTICVEGEIQVYSKIGTDDQARRSIFYKEDTKNVIIVDGVRYQLLNIIKSGSPLSSIISVLDLLTDPDQTLSSVAPTPRTSVSERNLPSPSDGFVLDSSSGMTPNTAGFTQFESSTSSSSTSGGADKSVLPEMIAIPKSNCTISIIPKESFTKISYKYPKAASHIIQMIIAKLYRVTFQTCHNYLDLTPDIYQTEINVNSYYHKLNKSITDDDLSPLSVDLINKLERSKNDEQGEDTTGDVCFADDKRSKRMKISRSIDTSISPQVTINDSVKPPKFFKRKSSRQIVLNSNIQSATSPGDLLSNVSLPNKIRDNDNLSFNLSQLERDDVMQRAFYSSDDNDDADDDEDTEFDYSLGGNIYNVTNDQEHNDSILRNNDFNEAKVKKLLAERITEMIGLDKDNFPLISLNNNGAQKSKNGPHLHNHLQSPGPINGIKYVKTESKTKLRTYSTNSYEATHRLNSELANGSTNLDIYKTLLNFENVQNEFVNDMKLKRVPKGTKIVQSDSPISGLFYIIQGGVDVSYKKKEISTIDSYYTNLGANSKSATNGGAQYLDEFIYHAKQNEIVGYLGTMIGAKSFVDMVTTEETYLAFIPRNFFEYIREKYPRVELSFAHHLMKVMDQKLYFSDYALEWMHLNAGETLYFQSDPANGIYIVLNGRFRAIGKKKHSHDDEKESTSSSSPSSSTTSAEEEEEEGYQFGDTHTRTKHLTENLNNEEGYQILSEFGQGESMGEIEVLTKSKRLSTVVAIRDGEVARIPRTLFEMIALTNPSIMVNISRIVANRVNEDGKTFNNNNQANNAMTNTNIKDEPMIQQFTNYRTLSLIPVTYGMVPIEEFADKLAQSLEKVGKRVKILNQSITLTTLGKYAFDKLAKLKLSGFFSDLEEMYDMVIYISDTTVNSDWTRTCIQQGDCILLLANAQLRPDVGEYERLLIKNKTTARTELVLLHPEKYVEPGSTNAWLKNRTWVHSFHHIQLNCYGNNDQNVNKISVKSKDATSMGNVASNATSVINTTLSQLDMITVLSTKFKNNIRNLLDDGLTKQKDYYQPMQEHKNDFMRLARILTGQAIGLVLGGGGARGISHVGIIKALEDQGIPVDIIGGTSIGAFVGGLYARDYDFVPVYGRVKTFSYRMGSLWRSVLDLTIPLTSYLTGHEFNRGIWKSFGDSRIEDFWIKYYTNSTNLTQSRMEIHISGYAWRFIRASMTLASLLPPMTNQEGDMLMDGGYIDNLTVNEMQRRGVHRIIAVDVGSEDDKPMMNYGDSLSGMWVLFNRLNPFSSHANVPTITDIQMKLAYVSSVSALERAKKSPNVVYLRPPIEGYATLDFGKFDEIYQVGVEYAEKMREKIQKKVTVGVLQPKDRFAMVKANRRYTM